MIFPHPHLRVAFRVCLADYAPASPHAFFTSVYCDKGLGIDTRVCPSLIVSIEFIRKRSRFLKADSRLEGGLHWLAVGRPIVLVRPHRRNGIKAGLS